MPLIYPQKVWLYQTDDLAYETNYTYNGFLNNFVSSYLNIPFLESEEVLEEGLGLEVGCVVCRTYAGLAWAWSRRRHPGDLLPTYPTNQYQHYQVQHTNIP